jgi:hypothetical protein
MLAPTYLTKSTDAALVMLLEYLQQSNSGRIIASSLVVVDMSDWACLYTKGITPAKLVALCEYLHVINKEAFNRRYLVENK